MKHEPKLAIIGVALVVSLFLMSTPLLSQDSTETVSGLVDFRMAPLEQARKIFQVIQTTRDSGVALTVMNRMTAGQDGRHVIVSEDQATASYLQDLLGTGSVDSVSWSPDSDIELYGTCDTQDDCEDKTDEMCKKAGHGGAKANSVKISFHSDGSKTCSASCKDNGAVAFVTCDPSLR